ncbi:sperm-tail PG-rich repeat-containing protein 2 [Manduca sexta]|uniref:sperm-tail PG-rich repeat-containing protein 2 n=1 Tax=Manduca sexta TaxID=7130 RepID=UPI00189055C3|nr:sperm-tail PG-rich repeat-containing protein 2 [Manduca sexta]
MSSKIPRFPYEALSKEDLEELLCRCGYPNPCECPLEEKEEELVTCHAKIPRRLFKGPAPPPLLANGLSTPSKGDHGFQISADGSIKRIKDKVTNESPPFYDVTVNDFTTFYQGCKWSKRTFQRSTKLQEVYPSPADYDIFKKPFTDFEICAENFRSYKRKTTKQLRFIEMVQQRNILENLPGPANYNVKSPKFHELQHLGPKARRFSFEKNDEAPGPANYWIRRDFDLAEIPEQPCHARLPEPSCFGVKDTRFKPLKEVGPSPATYSPSYKPCQFMKCSKAPFNNSAIRFKEEMLSETDEKDETTVENENGKMKKPCIVPTWQLKSKTRRFEQLKKKPCEPSPADLPQPTTNIERSRHLQFIAPFFSSEGRFQPWFDWMPVFGKVKTPGPCTYALEKPKCYPAVPHGPLSRAPRFHSHARDTPAPNEYNVGRGIETILATHNHRLKNNIENKHKFIWDPPVEPKQLSFEERITLLIHKSIALLEIGDVPGEKFSKLITNKSSGILEKRNSNKMLRSIVHGQKIVHYY